jgi:RNA polymerase sigma-70 factor (ECF subfamily)
MPEGEIVGAEAEVSMPPSLEDLLTHSRTVFLVCLGYVKNRADAEDMSQETYLRACRHLGELQDPASTRAWICRIARHVCLDQLRRLKLGIFGDRESPGPPVARTDPQDELERRELQAAVRRAIARLPRPQRDVLVLREYAELSYEEIARTLGIELGTVMSRLHRARRKLVETVRVVGGPR